MTTSMSWCELSLMPHISPHSLRKSTFLDSLRENKKCSFDCSLHLDFVLQDSDYLLVGKKIALSSQEAPMGALLLLFFEK